ncbi:hypothetical protein SAMN02745245_01458 [Anaerosphaera aminiphila DSM 21120]|uniref:Uncharacterized protein n=1 Tax=Anaerosphaera aminiphila DSM 21120 TaxID=1120995 RepID=A0A1M5TGJ2_9FIRM|nr:hypothetical protein [Anaerosphaera aminiphila]SHH49819.1 hypothetical protein SAMN02745245_01458 [Anaerosphaera aminiphila DSM 21120]
MKKPISNIIIGLMAILVTWSFINNGNFVYTIDFNVYPTVNSFIFVVFSIVLLFLYFVFKNTVKSEKKLNKIYLTIILFMGIIMTVDSVKLYKFYGYEKNMSSAYLDTNSSIITEVKEYKVLEEKLMKNY